MAGHDDCGYADFPASPLPFMIQPRAGHPDPLTLHWPEPAHLRLATNDGAPERCEIQFSDGTVETGELLRFTGRDEHLVFRPAPGQPRHPSKLVVRNSRFKRLKLLDPVAVEPLDAVFGSEPIDAQQLHVYTVEFSDHEIESGDTAGYVRNAIGLFLYFNRPDNRVERVFVPESAIAYFQAGEPIGRLLVEEHAVSEEQLAAAVEKQQEMRKLVLGDYLIDEGLIAPEQLQQALALQRTKPSLAARRGADRARRRRARGAADRARASTREPRASARADSRRHGRRRCRHAQQDPREARQVVTSSRSRTSRRRPRRSSPSPATPRRGSASSRCRSSTAT